MLKSCWSFNRNDLDLLANLPIKHTIIGPFYAFSIGRIS